MAKTKKAPSEVWVFVDANGNASFVVDRREDARCAWKGETIHRYLLAPVSPARKQADADAAFICGFVIAIADMLRQGHDHRSAKTALTAANITRTIAKRAGVTDSDLAHAWPKRKQAVKKGKC